MARFLEKTPEKWTDWKGTLSDRLHLLSFLRAEEVVMDYQLGSIRPKADDMLYDVVYVVSVADAASARKLADSVRLEGDRIVLTGLDGIGRTLDLCTKISSFGD